MGIDVADCCFLTRPKAGYRLTWEVTQYCPFKCEYCFTSSSPDRRLFEAPIQDVISRLKELISTLDIADVLITGGEPLAVIDELSPFLQYLSDRGIPFSFSTTIYDEARFEKLCLFRPRAINISVDPPANSKLDSAFKASQSKLSQKLALVADHDLEAKLTAVITRANLSGLPVLLDSLERQLNTKRISKIAFNREFSIGHAAPSRPLTQADLKDAYALLESWATSVSVPIKLVNWSEFHKPLQSCPAGRSLISVMQNAAVTPCSLLYNIHPSFSVGSLLRQPPELLRYRLEAFHSDLDAYHKKTANNTPQCGSCAVLPTCSGGCVAALPIATNRIVRRTCELAPQRAFDPQRVVLKELHDTLHQQFKRKPILVQIKQSLTSDLDSRIKEFVIANLPPTDLAHNIEHVEQVVSLARYICECEGASTKIAVPAAYLHDIAPREPAMHYLHTFKSAQIGVAFLSGLGAFSQEELDHIHAAIITSSYGAHILGLEPVSLEGEVVRDADLLDAIGARGIARVFAFNQAHGAAKMGCPDFDPESFSEEVDTNIVGPDESPIDHFQKKLLRVSEILLTSTARRLAQPRHQFMIRFLQQYKAEVVLPPGSAEMELPFSSWHQVQ